MDRHPDHVVVERKAIVARSWCADIQSGSGRGDAALALLKRNLEATARHMDADPANFQAQLDFVMGSRELARLQLVSGDVESFAATTATAAERARELVERAPDHAVLRWNLGALLVDGAFGHRLQATISRLPRV